MAKEPVKAPEKEPVSPPKPEKPKLTHIEDLVGRMEAVGTPNEFILYGYDGIKITFGDLKALVGA